MAEPKFATDGKLGVDLAAASSAQQFRLGTTARSAANNVVIYVFASEAIVSGTGVEMGASFTASSSATGEFTTIYALADGEFGWVEKTDTVIQG